eukprot:3868984-Rhodomonas_salina.1
MSGQAGTREGGRGGGLPFQRSKDTSPCSKQTPQQKPTLHPAKDKQHPDTRCVKYGTNQTRAVSVVEDV